MPAISKILKLLVPIVLIIFFASCAPAKKNPYYEKRLKASRTNTSQLGRNSYYFSSNYQKKLYKGYKRK